MAANNTHFYTRKNYIVLSLSALFSLLLLFVGLCLDANYTFLSKKNPIALLANSMNLPKIKAGASGLTSLLVFAIYVIIATWAIVSLLRYRFLTGKRTRSLGAWNLYLLAFLLCFGLSTLISYLILGGAGTTNFVSGMIFIGESFFLTLLLSLVLSLLVFGVVGAILNFAKVNRPFVFFSSSPEEDSGEFSHEEKTKVEKDEKESIESAFGETSSEEASLPTALSSSKTNAASLSVSTGENAEVPLTDRSKVFPTLSAVDEKYHGIVLTKREAGEISLKELASGFRNYLAKHQKLYYSQNTINAFLAGFSCSRLTILEGISGTGKSSLPRYFASYTQSKAFFLPVQASFRDKTSLLGYFSDFTKTYHETDFLKNLYEASYDPDRLTIFVLDEMNISRVEYYFADFLSVLEYPKEDWKISLMQLPAGFLPPLHLEEGYLRIPENVYFVGTANKDDSTFPISNKVYDRALTIDFEDRNPSFEVEEEAPAISLSRSRFESLLDEAYENPQLSLSQEEKNRFNKIRDFLKENFGLVLGNRVEDQMAHFIPAFLACGGSKEDALDALLSTKLLSRLEGRFEDSLKDNLYRLLDLLTDSYGKEAFPLSRGRIASLLRRL